MGRKPRERAGLWFRRMGLQESSCCFGPLAPFWSRLWKSLPRSLQRERDLKHGAAPPAALALISVRVAAIIEACHWGRAIAWQLELGSWDSGFTPFYSIAVGF